jgi:DNA-binding MarR family transcriptional regulator
MNPLSLTRMVDRRVMEGLVRHQAGMSDPRQVNLMLTELGRKSTAWARTVTRRSPTCWEKEK